MLAEMKPLLPEAEARSVKRIDSKCVTYSADLTEPNVIT